MSIVIDGIEQPKDCAHCRFALNQDYCIVAQKYIPHEVLIGLQRAEFCTARPVVRGKWLPTRDYNKKECSKCHVIHLIAQYPAGRSDWCPNCGADMREVNND